MVELIRIHHILCLEDEGDATAFVCFEDEEIGVLNRPSAERNGGQAGDLRVGGHCVAGGGWGWCDDGGRWRQEG